METPMTVDPAEINPAVATAEEIASLPGLEAAPTRAGGGSFLVWLLILLAVIGFGYLSGARRAAIGAFVAQVSDVIKDFRGYDPEV